jgi:hypothetical protein
MKLGILVNTDKHLNDIIGITEAAAEGGHGVIIFAMDDGTRLIEETSFTALSAKENVSMGFCDHSALQLGVNKNGLPEDIIVGSQYDNAVMDHESDRVIVL